MNEKIVVSLSTIPPRFGNLGETLTNILNQNYTADEIRVYIPKYYRRFPKHSFSLPEIPRRGNIKIKVVDDDLGPATKVLYCAKAYWGTRTRIIYCDDDRLPDRNWLQAFKNASSKNTDKAIVASGFNLSRYNLFTSKIRYPRAVKKRVIENPGYIRARIHQKVKEIVFQKPFQKPSRINFKRPGYIDIGAGYGGVSIKPEFFDSTAFKIPDILWTTDDIWLSGFLEINNIGIWADNSIKVPICQTKNGDRMGLGGSLFEGKDRHTRNKNSIQYLQRTYNIWN